MAYAANDGTLGSSSSGDVLITVDVVAQAKITGLADFALGHYDPSTGLDLEQTNTNVCVYAQGPGGNVYDVTLSSAVGGAAALRLQNAALNTVDYQVFWAIDAGPETQLLAGSNAGNSFQGATSVDCTATGDPTASIRVLVPASTLSSAPVGQYTDTLTITIDPV